MLFAFILLQRKAFEASGEPSGRQRYLSVKKKIGNILSLGNFSLYSADHLKQPHGKGTK